MVPQVAFLAVLRMLGKLLCYGIQLFLLLVPFVKMLLQYSYKQAQQVEPGRVKALSIPKPASLILHRLALARTLFRTVFQVAGVRFRIPHSFR
ncbi:hypothetical protein AM218_08820 [Hymenobacter sp. DG25A]|nr:hypothetical protein AM218_08820 [Hymenobacter sp. DG25A]